MIHTYDMKKTGLAGWLAGWLNGWLVSQRHGSGICFFRLLPLTCGSRPELQKRNKNQWFCDLRLQKHSKTYHFGNFGWEMMIPDPRDKKRQ